jgi:hypothetical protein
MRATPLPLIAGPPRQTWPAGTQLMHMLRILQKHIRLAALRWRSLACVANDFSRKGIEQ